MKKKTFTQDSQFHKESDRFFLTHPFSFNLLKQENKKTKLVSLQKMEEGNKTEKKGCLISVIIVCIVLTVGFDIVAGFVGLQAEAAQQDVKYILVQSTNEYDDDDDVYGCILFLAGEAQ